MSLRNQKPNKDNVIFGELVNLASMDSNKNRSFSNGYHSGVKILFFNKKGVFVGNEYKFVSYDDIRFKCNYHVFPRHFMIKKNGKYRNQFCEFVLQSLYEIKCKITSFMIRNCYKD